MEERSPLLGGYFYFYYFFQNKGGEGRERRESYFCRGGRMGEVDGRGGSLRRGRKSYVEEGSHFCGLRKGGGWGIDFLSSSCLAVMTNRFVFFRIEDG